MASGYSAMTGRLDKSEMAKLQNVERKKIEEQSAKTRLIVDSPLGMFISSSGRATAGWDKPMTQLN